MRCQGYGLDKLIHDVSIALRRVRCDLHFKYVPSCEKGFNRLAACKMRQPIQSKLKLEWSFNRLAACKMRPIVLAQLASDCGFQSPCGVQDATTSFLTIIIAQNGFNRLAACKMRLLAVWLPHHMFSSFNRLAACKMRLYTEKNRRIFGAVSHFQGSPFAFPTKRNVFFCRILCLL